MTFGGDCAVHLATKSQCHYPKVRLERVEWGKSSGLLHQLVRMLTNFFTKLFLTTCGVDWVVFSLYSFYIF